MATIPAGSVLALTDDQLDRRAPYLSALSAAAADDVLSRFTDAEIAAFDVSTMRHFGGESELVPVTVVKPVQFKRGELVALMVDGGIGKTMFEDLAEAGSRKGHAVSLAVKERRARDAANLDKRKARGTDAETVAAERKKSAKQAKTNRRTPADVAAEYKIDLDTIEGTGKNGAVTVSDVKRAHNAALSAASTDKEKALGGAVT